MSAAAAVERRVLRRETHPSRTVPAVVTAIALAIIAAGALAASAWAMADPGLPERAMSEASRLVASIDAGALVAALVAAAAVAVVLGVVLICLALLPGRLPRRGRRTERMAVIVDDALIADAAADDVAAIAGIDRTQVSTSIGRRALDVWVTPSSGLEVDEEAARSAARDAAARLGAPVRVGVTVASRGVIA